jgi:hypothetical protein
MKWARPAFLAVPQTRNYGGQAGSLSRALSISINFGGTRRSVRFAGSSGPLQTETVRLSGTNSASPEAIELMLIGPRRTPF